MTIHLVGRFRFALAIALGALFSVLIAAGIQCGGIHEDTNLAAELNRREISVVARGPSVFDEKLRRRMSSNRLLENLTDLWVGHTAITGERVKALASASPSPE